MKVLSFLIIIFLKSIYLNEKLCLTWVQGKLCLIEITHIELKFKIFHCGKKRQELNFEQNQSDIYHMNFYNWNKYINDI